MEVLNASPITPLSLHKPTTTTTTTTINNSHRRKISSLRYPKPPSINPSQLILPDILSRGFAALSVSLLGVLSPAKALTYEEALGQVKEIAAPLSDVSADNDIGGFIDGVAGFVSENPLIIGGGVVVLAVPLVLSKILKNTQPFRVESAKNAYAKLSEDAGAQLLDIREGRDIKEMGSPDVRSLKKKAVSIAYRGDDKPGFLKKLALKFKDPESTTLFVLDKFDGNSELVAELATANGFKAAFAIKDGAEGARGWMNSGLPWTQPKKTLNVDFSELKDAITSVLGEGSDGLPVTLGLAAATGIGIFAITEIETVLQLLGSAALVQFVTKKILFEEDRKVTLRQIDEFLTTKIAPNELVDEIKMIVKALLPVSITSKASLPAPTKVKPDTSASTTPVQEVVAIPETKAEVKVEYAPEQPLILNSVPKAEVSEESLPVRNRALSPYPCYPDFKPPSSPSPSQP